VSFERPYGLAWLLLLAAELREWESPEAKAWSRRSSRSSGRGGAAARVAAEADAADPDRRALADAFSLGLVLDWARVAGRRRTRRLVEERSRDFYGRDRACPLAYEPSGEDFLSPCLGEAD